MSTIQLFSFIPFFNEELLGDVKVALFTVLIKMQGKKFVFLQWDEDWEYQCPFNG